MELAMKCRGIKIIGLALVLLFAGCSTTSHYQPLKRFNQAHISQHEWLKNKQRTWLQFETLPSPEREEKQLEFLALLLANNQQQDAIVFFQYMKSQDLPARLQPNYALVAARIFISQNQPDKALKLIRPYEDASHLPLEKQAAFHQTKAEALHEMGHYYESAKERVWLDELLTDSDAIQTNRHALWESLLELTPTALELLTPSQPPDMLSGWMNLAQLYLTHQTDFDVLVQEVQRWKNQYPLHPAHDSLPEPLASFLVTSPLITHKIALVLPLSGQYAKTGHAIQDGLMTAYYERKQKRLPTPEVVVFDSSNVNDIPRIYQSIVAQDIDAIIGPLTKPAVSAMADIMNDDIPTLTLNFNEQAESSDALFQFGLAPEDEVTMVIKQAKLMNYNNALALLPNNSWGKRLYEDFRSKLEQAGGKVLDVVFYNANHDLTKPIKQILALNDSVARAKRIEGILGQNVHFEPRRRKDIDFIFLGAFPEEGRQIRPMLSFFYAGDLPILSTSHIYTGTEAVQDKDLNSVYFCDMPWILTPPRDTYQIFASQWENEYQRHKRLFALGYDALSVLPHINRMKHSPLAKLRGLTGHLYMDHQQQIHRELLWAQFKDGKPRIQNQPL